MARISVDRKGEYVYTALQVVADNGGVLPSSEVVKQTEARLDLNDYELERLEKSGYVRWYTYLHFNSVMLTKAGWVRKEGGKWYITDEGLAALELGQEEFLKKVEQPIGLGKSSGMPIQTKVKEPRIPKKLMA